MQVADSREVETTEIWIEGDLATNPDGAWYTLSESGLVTLVTTPEDGLKTFTVKLRNIYGAESDEVTAEILKKSEGATGCDSTLASTTTNDRRIGIHLEAVNTGPVYYIVFGDLEEESDLQSFTSGEVVEVVLSQGIVDKTITVQIQDATGTVCLQE